MNNTIEPRLIALLNDEPSELYNTSTCSLNLPPLHDPNILKASGRPLILEPDASKRNEKHSASAQLASKHNNLLNPLDDDDKVHTKESAPGNAGERALGVSSPQSLRKILDDDNGAAVPVSTKKRHVVEPSKDDFVQLPQPPKKQKTAKQVVPPIINGLFEPPPQATLFPPIASSSFHDSHGRNSLNTAPPKVKVAKEKPEPKPKPTDHVEQGEPQQKGHKKRKPSARKKWTEEETSALLLGVAKHGIGCWTDIVKDPTFTFNERSALDLKDRFRTCCPDELRGQKGKIAMHTQGSTPPTKPERAKARSGLMSQNILISDSEMEQNTAGGETPPNRYQKPRAHRKKLEDLATLGIRSEVPFRQSDRRERRSYTDEEDRAILEGFKAYGFNWSTIQRDPRFNLHHRQPTDIRDRIRHKHPDMFKKAVEERKKHSKSTHVPTPSPRHISTRGKLDDSSTGITSSSGVHESDSRMFDGSGKENWMTSTQQPLPQTFSSREGLRIQEIISTEQELSRALPLQQSTSMFNFKDNYNNFGDQTTMDAADSLPFSQAFDWNTNIAAPYFGNSGEMDISRLLLDETWTDIPTSSSKEKQSFTDSNSIINSSSQEPGHNGPSFFNLLNDVEDMNDGSFN